MRKEQVTWDGIGEINVDEISMEGCQNLVIAYVEMWMHIYEKAYKGFLWEEKNHSIRTTKCMYYLGTVEQAKAKLRKLNYLNYATSFAWDEIFEEKERMLKEEFENDKR